MLSSEVDSIHDDRLDPETTSSLEVALSSMSLTEERMRARLVLTKQRYAELLRRLRSYALTAHHDTRIPSWETLRRSRFPEEQLILEFCENLTHSH
ncbi:unnamed protein product [Amoebophrya sp. A25]|nr:unnamed protein product [Amoebophrya sp. A25]|eukprot:GSA25T00017768001.1